LRLAEALVFASAAPVSARALSQLLPDTADADAVIAALRARYAGRGVELVETAGGVQFRTAVELAPRLRKVIEVPRKLPRVAMETLAIIAYHQPCTRPEIEEIRGTSLSQQTLDALLEANLVAPKGRREVPGRPTLWGTTPQFLAQFGLKDIRDLPQRGDLLLETPQPTGVSNAPPLGPDLPEPPPETGPAPPDRAAQPDAGVSGEPTEGQGRCPLDPRSSNHSKRMDCKGCTGACHRALDPVAGGPGGQSTLAGSRAEPWSSFGSPASRHRCAFAGGADGLHAARQRAALLRS
jgi:segregation and condensation protein B